MKKNGFYPTLEKQPISRFERWPINIIEGFDFVNGKHYFLKVKKIKSSFDFIAVLNMKCSDRIRIRPFANTDPDPNPLYNPILLSR